jgi:hypothetical protein
MRLEKNVATCPPPLYPAASSVTKAFPPSPAVVSLRTASLPRQRDATKKKEQKAAELLQAKGFFAQPQEALEQPRPRVVVLSLRGGVNFRCLSGGEREEI